MKTVCFLRKAALLLLGAAVIASCDKDEVKTDNPDTAGTNGDIAFEISFAPDTRVSTDANFKSVWETGDEIGIFAVKRTSGTTASLSATATGNYFNNVKLTYTEATPGVPGTASWRADSGAELWWPADGDVLDFYAYHPYDASVTDPTAITFKVKTDQSGTTGGKSNYNLSDLLNAKSDNDANGWSKGSTVKLTFHHALSMVQVTINDRFEALDTNEDITMKLLFVMPGATLDLGGTAGPATELTNDEATDITMYCVEDAAERVYRALVPAQALREGAPICRVSNAGNTFDSSKLKADIVMAAGQAEAFTQRLSSSQVAYIPPGTFSMGEDGWGAPVHEVTLDGFYMTKYLVTNEQYAAFLNATGVGESGLGRVTYEDGGTSITEFKGLVADSTGESDYGMHWNADKWEPAPGYEKYPAIYVTWFGAKAYAHWVGGDLPTEAQWEYACRAGTTTSFYFGEESQVTITDYGWTGDNNTTEGYPSGTKPVGLKAPNPHGLYDMYGNVYEWCNDWHGAYSGEAVTNPTGPETGSSRILRGGNWYYSSSYARSASRHFVYPSYPWANDVGFRVVYAL